MMTKKAETETKAKERERERGGREKMLRPFCERKFAFALTYVVYIFVYFTRKPFAIFKTPMREDMRMSGEGIGTMDSLFLAAYASSQFSVGIVSAKLGVRTALSLALLDRRWPATGQTDSQWTATALWTANGAFQAACSLIMRALSPWFSSSVRGKVFGVWTTSQQVGGYLHIVCGIHGEACDLEKGHGHLRHFSLDCWRDCGQISSNTQQSPWR